MCVCVYVYPTEGGGRRGGVESRYCEIRDGLCIGGERIARRYGARERERDSERVNTFSDTRRIAANYTAVQTHANPENKLYLLCKLAAYWPPPPAAGQSAAVADAFPLFCGCTGASVRAHVYFVIFALRTSERATHSIPD